MSARALSAIVVLSLSSGVFAAEWPQYRGPGHDGVTPEKINTRWSTPPKVQWRIPLGSSLGSFVTGNGRLYVFAKDGDDEAAQAFDAATGKRLWSTTIGKTIFDNSGGDGPRSTPALDDGRVYIYGTYQKLGCLDAADGKMIWSHDLNKEFGGKEPGWGSATSPLVDGNLVLVCCGGRGQSFVAFDKKSGSVAWKGQYDAPTHAAPIPADLLGIHQVIFFTTKGLAAVNPRSGDVLWRQAFPFNVSTAASPVVCGPDIVYCSAGYGSGSAAFQISKSGDHFVSRELWHLHSKYLVNQWSTPIYKDGYLYGLYGFKEFQTEPLKCVDLKTGKEVWSHPGFGQGQVVMAGGNLLVQGDRGDLVLVKPSPDGYHEIARCQPFDANAKCWTDPAVADGHIYARSQTGGVCLDVAPPSGSARAE